jgi:hypothetical protein
MKIPFCIKTLKLTLCCASSLLAQGNTAAPPSGQTLRPIGMILAIDSAAKRITIKTDAGPEMKTPAFFASPRASKTSKTRRRFRRRNLGRATASWRVAGAQAIPLRLRPPASSS